MIMITEHNVKQNLRFFLACNLKTSLFTTRNSGSAHSDDSVELFLIVGGLRRFRAQQWTLRPFIPEIVEFAPDGRLHFGM
jgi:hypothetical protein